MDVEQIKEANPIEEVIGEEIALRKSGRYLRGVEHDSLVVDPAKQAFFWNSEARSGDVFTWVEWRQRTDFRGAVEWLCRQAKLEPPRWSGDGAQQAARRAVHDALTVACRHFVRCLRQSPEGMAYCQSRGWTEETIREAGLGFWNGDRKGLEGELSMHGIKPNRPEARALMAIPAGSLVYAHVWAGRVVYFSTRMASQTEKRHWNPPLDLVGERRPYYNHLYSPVEGLVVVVEGQADAVTLAQWDIAAVALAGLSPTADLLRRLKGHQTIVLGLDQDGAGKKWTAPLADALGPLTRLMSWPAHDVNDWLQAGGTAEEARALIQSAGTWVERLAAHAGGVDGLDREHAIRRAFTQIARMEDFEVAMRRSRLTKAMGLGVRPFNAMLKAARGESAAEAQSAEEEPRLEIPIPGGLVGDHLLEMIVVPPEENAATGKRPTWRTRFACRYPDGSVQVVDQLDWEGIRYVPISSMNRMLTERVVQFPSALGEKLPLRDLVNRVRDTIHKYVDIDVFYEWLSSYYVMFSWLYDSFNTLPYLRLLGDAGTGKSRFLQVVGALCYRPMFVTGAATVSPIFRIIDQYRGTLALDEADYKQSDEAADIVKILNTGYQRVQGVVLRSGDKQTGFETEVYVTYCPKVIATRRKFADWALESRCLTYETGGPTTRLDIPIDLPRSFWTAEAPAMRNLLLRYRLENWQPEIELDYSRLDVEAVEPRLNQVTIALLTLIDDEDLVRDLRFFIQEYNRQLIVERGMTLTAKVLEAIVGLQAMSLEIELEIPLKDITKAANILIDIENEEYEEKEEEDEEKKEKRFQLKARKVGDIVRRQLHFKTKRTGKRGMYVMSWEHDRVQALRKRFGIDEEWEQRTAAILRENMPASASAKQLPF